MSSPFNIRLSSIQEKDQRNGYRSSHISNPVHPPDLIWHLAMGIPGSILSSIFAHLLGIWPFLRYVGLRFIRSSSIPVPPLMMNYAIFSFLSQILSQITQNGDILILDHFSNQRNEIGFYSLALLFVLAAT